VRQRSGFRLRKFIPSVKMSQPASSLSSACSAFKFHVIAWKSSCRIQAISLETRLVKLPTSCMVSCIQDPSHIHSFLFEWTSQPSERLVGSLEKLSSGSTYGHSHGKAPVKLEAWLQIEMIKASGLVIYASVINLIKSFVKMYCLMSRCGTNVFQSIVIKPLASDLG